MSTPVRMVAVACMVAAAFVAGWMANRPSGESGPAGASVSSGKTQRWECPMHPQYTSDRPGDCPICGMRLVEAAAGSHSATTQGAITIGLAQQQLIGVRSEELQRAPASQLLRVPGRIAVDESRLHVLVAAADGWIRELGDNSAGTYVKKDQVLASYYTPNILAAQQSLLYSLRTAAPLQRAEVMLSNQIAPNVLNVQTAIDALRSLGMSDLQLEELQRTKSFSPEIRVHSPISGYVVARNVSPGQRFDKGTELFRIADLSHVWVMTDLFEKDRVFVEPGAVATVLHQGQRYQARMSDVLPQFDPQSRTLKTRFELDNPGNILRPDMFVDVELHVTMPAALTLPSDAIIDTGRRKTVYVDRGNGAFEPRVVETGWRLGDRVEITAGLTPAERIVVSGNFLIDSESRMRLATAGGPVSSQKGTTEIDPVCGMEVDLVAPNVFRTQVDGKTYYFCSGRCKRDFEANPRKYSTKQQSSHDASRKPGDS